MRVIVQQQLPTIPWRVPALARLPGVLPLSMAGWRGVEDALGGQMGLRGEGLGARWGAGCA